MSAESPHNLPRTKRPRRRTMIKLIACVVLGIVTTLGVAWWVVPRVLIPTFFDYQRISEWASADGVWYVLTWRMVGGESVWVYTTSSERPESRDIQRLVRPGAVPFRALVDEDDYLETGEIREWGRAWRSGWPFYATYAWVEDSRQQKTWPKESMIDDAFAVWHGHGPGIALIPVWTGLIANTAFYSAFWSLPIFVAPLALRKVRARRPLAQ